MQGREASQGQAEMANRVKELERKLRNLEGDINQAQEDSSASERARRAAESERDELQEEISSANAKAYVCQTVLLLLIVILVMCLFLSFTPFRVVIVTACYSNSTPPVYFY